MNHQQSSMSPLSSDGSGYHLGHSSPNTVHTVHSAQSPDFSTMELYLAQTDHGPELSPAERVHDLSQPQPSPGGGEKTGFGFGLGMHSGSKSKPKPESSKRKRKHWWIGGLVVLLLIIIALAIALPVALTRRGKKSRYGCSASLHLLQLGWAGLMRRR